MRQALLFLLYLSLAGGLSVLRAPPAIDNLAIPAPSAAQQTALAHTFTVFHHYSLCTYLGCQWDLQTAPATGSADARDLVVVRPDGYVGFAGSASDRAGAEVYLRTIAA